VSSSPPELSKGLSLYRAGKFDEARRCYEAILEREPRNERVLHLLALVHLAARRTEEAAALFRQCLAIRPRFPEALTNLGQALLALGRAEDAVEMHRRALEVAPQRPEVHGNLGNALQALERHEEAVAAYRKAIALRPAMAGAHNHLGNSLKALGHLNEAASAFERTIAASPQHAEAWNNLANTLCDLKQFERADAAYARARAAQPDAADIKYNEAFAHLLRGDYRRGWEHFDCRSAMRKGAGPRSFSPPRWTGSSPLQGKSLLVYAEQGLGDTLQFIRYVRILRRVQAANILLEVQPGLKGLLSGLPDAGRIFGQGEKLPDFDFHCPLMSLPRIFGTQLDSIPDSVPYLTPPADQAARWRAALAKSARPRVGLVWAGNPRHPQDRFRSIPLSLLLPAIRDLPGSFFVLQKDLRPGDRELIAAAPELTDLSAQLADFTDTAAIVAALDLVVTVDTAVAHLAGSLAVPTWLLLPFAPDWRWLLERTDSPWYPTFKLFRPPAVGDWRAVLAQVRSDWAKQTSWDFVDFNHRHARVSTDT
jgi:tetratricopeptide (TPR) repeat protein